MPRKRLRLRNMPVYLTNEGVDEWLTFDSTADSTWSTTYWTTDSSSWNDDYFSVTNTATPTAVTTLIYPKRWYWVQSSHPRIRFRRYPEWMDRHWQQQLDSIEMEASDRQANAIAREAQRQVIAAHVDTAQSKAMDLLLKHLTPEQQDTFKRNRWFIVEGGVTGRRYRIRDQGNVVANIDLLNENDAVEHRLCGHCDAREVPLGDNLLAQKLMLEADESAFLRIANRHAAR